MFIKKILILLSILFFIQQSALSEEVINAKNNAYIHNNKGIMYLNENYYYGAIKEFQIAIDLNPNTQVSSIFYTNLGKTYEKIGYHNLAKTCYEKAIKLNVLCFEYYLQLAKNYKNLNIIEKKIEEYQSKTHSPLNNIMIGLLYIQKGNVSTGITVLDDFCNKEPNLIITQGVQNYIKELTKDL